MTKFFCMNHFLSQLKTHAYRKQSNSTSYSFPKILLHPKEPHARSIDKKEKQTERKVSLLKLKFSKHRQPEKKESKVEDV